MKKNYKFGSSSVSIETMVKKSVVFKLEASSSDSVERNKKLKHCA